MSKFEELLTSMVCQPSVIVRLGAGSRSELETYKTNKSSKIIYVEPDQKLAETIAATLLNTAHVKIITSAIAAENGRQMLNITNNRQFSSLLEPNELLDFYPNIKTIDKPEVNTKTLSKFCLDEAIDGNSDNLLVAELQGMEKVVFPSVDSETLQKFRWVLIRSSDHNLYGPASGKVQKSIAEIMQSAGFVVLTFKENTPPFINFLCIRNDESIEKLQLENQISGLLNSINKNEDESSKQKDILINLKSTVIRRSAEIDKSMALIQMHEEEREQALRLIQNYEREKEYSQTLIQSLELEIKNQNLRSMELEESNQEKSKQISEIQQTLRINNKLILRSDTDLRDLQLQYKSSIQHQEQQHELLCDLKEKLQQASQFYRKLNLQNLVSDSTLLEQNNSESAEPASEE